jgi:hypothetical protein
VTETKPVSKSLSSEDSSFSATAAGFGGSGFEVDGSGFEVDGNAEIPKHVILQVITQTN